MNRRSPSRRSLPSLVLLTAVLLAPGPALRAETGGRPAAAAVFFPPWTVAEADARLEATLRVRLIARLVASARYVESISGQTRTATDGCVRQVNTDANAESCWIRVGQGRGAELMVTGEIARAGDSCLLTLRLVRLETRVSEGFHAQEVTPCSAALLGQEIASAATAWSGGSPAATEVAPLPLPTAAAPPPTPGAPLQFLTDDAPPPTPGAPQTIFGGGRSSRGLPPSPRTPAESPESADDLGYFLDAGVGLGAPFDELDDGGLYLAAGGGLAVSRRFRVGGFVDFARYSNDVPSGGVESYSSYQGGLSAGLVRPGGGHAWLIDGRVGYGHSDGRCTTWTSTSGSSDRCTATQGEGEHPLVGLRAALRLWHLLAGLRANLIGPGGPSGALFVGVDWE